MRSTHLFHTILIVLLTLSTTIAAMPRLTVVIMVDGLQQQSLQQIQTYLPKGGLRTLNEEAYQTQVSFPHWVFGGNEATASLLTGYTPMQHGYAMDNYFNRTTRLPEPLLRDLSVRGIGTDDQLSPTALLGPTISDQLRLIYGQASHIYAVGLSPATTILLAGHGANACCWLDDRSHQWVSTSYYSGGLPTAADQMNISGRIEQVLSREWVPRMDMALYSAPTEEERKHGFKYTGIEDFHTPMANTLVIELALQLQQQAQLGNDNIPDMVLLHLSLQTPKSQSDAIHSAEQEDMYLSLNQDIGYLIDQLVRRIGKDNLQILMLGKPLQGESSQRLEAAGLGLHPFSVARAAALTSTYLMAIYGHERWVDGGYGPSIYLNRALIEQKKLSIGTIQRQVSDFLMDFEGIQLAFPRNEALMRQEILTSYTKRCFGDILFTLQPGWQLMEDDTHPIDRVVNKKTLAPVILWSGAQRPSPTQSIEIKDIPQLLFY